MDFVRVRRWFFLDPDCLNNTALLLRDLFLSLQLARCSSGISCSGTMLIGLPLSIYVQPTYDDFVR